MTRALLTFGLGLFVAACDRDAGSDLATGGAPGDESASLPSASAQPGASAPAPSEASGGGAPAAGGSASAAPAAGAPPARTEGCPDGMVRVAGDYCPSVIQDCLEHHPEYAKDPDNPTVSERCLRYANPSKCMSKERRPLDFCMDRYEYPNVAGELPRLLTSWLEAREMCKEAGKRLCTEDEYNFACEGPEMLPHVYGFDRDDRVCNIDKPYRKPDHSRQMLTYDKCLATDWCKAEIERLDQRHRIAETHTCASWAGVIDLNGNVNEWVDLPGKEPPHRSGLKGGWWGPVRGRCRPTVGFHKENDYGYEVGFRCCKDADGPVPSTPK